MSDFFLIVAGVSLITQPIALIYLLVQIIRRKPRRKGAIALLLLIVTFVSCESIGVATMCKHDLTLIEEIEPSCTEHGKKISHCSICDKDITVTISKLGHNFQVASSKEPTVLSEGFEILRCSRCHYEKTHNIDKLECQHNWIEATCIEKATCSICGKTKGKTTNHDFEVVNRIEPTAISEGSETLRCSRCQYEETKKIDKIKCQHNWSKATCIEKSTCSICGKTQGKFAEHLWKEATCVEPKICNICGKTKGKTADHTWQKATCTKPETCSVCGLTRGGTIDHTWLDATETDPQTCSVCGATQGSRLLSNSDIYGIWRGPQDDGRTAYLYFCSNGVYCMFSKATPSSSSFTSEYKIADGYKISNSKCTFYSTANGKSYECSLTQDGDFITMYVSGSTIEGSYDQISTSTSSSSSGGSNSSGGAESGKTCTVDGCTKNATKSYTNPFSGKSEPYCTTHYNEIIEMMGEMEQSVGSSSSSKHTCEECSREGIHKIIGFSGKAEYYCTKHYEEIREILEQLEAVPNFV